MMHENLQRKKTDTHSEMLSLRLLGGKSIAISLSKPFTVTSDSRNIFVDLTWIDRRTLWGGLVAKLALDLFSTHSPQYAGAVAYKLKRIFSSAIFDQDKPIVMEQLSRLPELVPISYWPFIQPFLKRWAAEDTLGSLGEDVKKFLEQPQKWDGGTKPAYWALLVNDPDHGALTEQELHSVQDGLNEAFERRRITLEDYALVWLLIGTGVRPVQIARMKRDDVQVIEGPEGKEVLLFVPLAKGEKIVQTEKWERRCPTVVAEVLIAYLEKMRLADNEPLFADQSTKLKVRFDRVFQKIRTYSARTGGAINLTPYRFRYTLGTRAIAQGATDHEAARLLTHRTTFCVAYYRASMPHLQKPIRSALSGEMKFLAKAFKGTLIEDLSDASRRNDVRALIRDFLRLTGDKLGACGTSVDCHQHAPIACLSCRKFEPFIGSPWEALLDKIASEMEREPEDRIKMILLHAVTAIREIIVERDKRFVDRAAHA